MATATSARLSSSRKPAPIPMLQSIRDDVIALHEKMQAFVAMHPEGCRCRGCESRFMDNLAHEVTGALWPIEMLRMALECNVVGFDVQ